MKGLLPEASLMDKIIKVYKGCEGWASLESVLSEWFGLGDEIEYLADIANQWRNELAHEKKQYDPDEKVISAIRLVEHLNYAIVLRQARYSDEHIKEILNNVLIR